MSRKRKREWRLPTILELLTLVDYTKHNPASSDPGIDSDGYWSSITYAFGTSYAWYVYFNNGCTSYNNKAYTNSVRYVRNTKNGLEWSRTMDEKMTWDEAIKYAEDMNEEAA